MFVDGYDETTKTVYEFHGCFYHGCAKCFPIHRYRKHNCHPDRTISEIFEATRQKTQKLRQAGYTVSEKWEHDFEIEKKSNPTVMEFLKTFSLSEPLNPRDSFFGGRTNGVRLHRVAAAGEGNSLCRHQFALPIRQQNKNVSSGPSRDLGAS